MTQSGHSVDYEVQQVCTEIQWFRYRPHGQRIRLKTDVGSLWGEVTRRRGPRCLPIADACSAPAPHAFSGIDDKVIRKITRFINNI